MWRCPRAERIRFGAERIRFQCQNLERIRFLAEKSERIRSIDPELRNGSVFLGKRIRGRIRFQISRIRLRIRVFYRFQCFDFS